MSLDPGAFETIVPCRYITFTFPNPLPPPLPHLLRTPLLRIAVLDSPSPSPSIANTREAQVAALLVPPNREHDWIFSIQAGHLQLLLTFPRLSRLILISNYYATPDCFRPRSYKPPLSTDSENNAAQIEVNLMPLLVALTPKSAFDQDDRFPDIPFLRYEDEVISSLVLEICDGPCVGEMMVENVELELGPSNGTREFRRRLRFKRMPNLIQTQVWIHPVVALDASDELEGIEFRVDNGILVQPYLSPMVAGLLLISSHLDERIQMGFRPKALCLGIGGGALVEFLSSKLEFEVVGVEEDEVVLNVAKKYFGLEEGELVHLCIGDGIEAIQKLAFKEKYHDAIGRREKLLLQKALLSSETKTHTCKMGKVELFSMLPLPIIGDILSRLPIESIFQCRCVCRTWLKLLSEKEFAILHLSRSPSCLIINNLDFHSSDESCFNLVELEDEPDHHNVYVARTKLILPNGCGKDGLTMVGSVNGLVCVNDYEHCLDTIYLWNPTMRESITLPPPDGVRQYPNVVSYGFGLSSISGHYKVVRIFQELEKSSRKILKSICHVYVLGESSWKTTGYCPYLYNCRTHGIFLNGNLHWLICDPDGSELISCFDLEKESFGPFPAPPELSKDFNLASLGLLGCYLSVCDNTSDFEIVMWVMKEYGMKKTWSKEFVIDKLPAGLVGPSYEVVRVLKVFKDGEILLLWRDDILLSYDSNRKTLHRSRAHKLIKTFDNKMKGVSFLVNTYPCIEAMEYVSSFLSLEDTGSEKV